MMYYLLALIAGASNTTQTSINTKVSQKFGSPLLGSIFSFGTAWILSGILLLIFDRGMHIPFNSIAEEPFWIWFGGPCGTGIVALSILCLPKLGSALNVMLIAFGQIMTGLLVDSFGLFASPVIPLSIFRIIGAVLVIIGVVLVSGKISKDNNSSTNGIYYLLAFLAGVCCALQVAINGRLTVVTNSSWRSTFVSMTFGTLGVLLVILIAFIKGGKKGIMSADYRSNDEKEKWYTYTGGVLAVIIVGLNALTAPIIGAGIVAILNQVAQIAAGIIIDITGFLGIDKKPITSKKVFGIISLIIGTVLIALF